MSEEPKKSYRVKPGFTHGAFNQYKAGDTVELTPKEAAGFLDKLQLIGESQPYEVRDVTRGGLLVSPDELDRAKQRIAELQQELEKANGQSKAQTGDTPPAEFNAETATPDEVLAAVKDGKITANAALIVEQQRATKRNGLIKDLTKLVEAESKP